MAVDASKLRKRRSLGAPPKDGSPGIDETAVLQAVEGSPRPPPSFVRTEINEAKASARFGPAGVSGAATSQRSQPTALSEPLSARLPSELAPNPVRAAGRRLEGEGSTAPELQALEELKASVQLRDEPTLGRIKGEQAAPQQRQRVPPPEAEPRIPFTTRVAASTKERLEDACYHLRIKHQQFIDEAIRNHLEKHGF